MDDVKAWYLSKAIWGGVLAALAGMFQLFGATLAPDDLGQLNDSAGVLVDQGPAIVAAVGGILAVVGRVFAKQRLTK